MPAVEELVFQTEKFFKFFIDILETLFLIKLRGFVSRMFLFPKILPHSLWTASKDPEAQPGRWGGNTSSPRARQDVLLSVHART